MSIESKPLAGKVAVVLGATRASGRGAAIELGIAGATVYCTGRSSRADGVRDKAPETIEETAEMVEAHGGVAIPVKVDHTDETQVAAFFERVGQEQGGRLDVLVNVGASGGHPNELVSWAEGLPFWEADLDGGLSILRGVTGHLITNRYAIPLMAARNSGLIVEVTDGTSYSYRGKNWGMFYYSLPKIMLIHTAEALAADFRHKKLDGMAAVALTPGYLRSESILRGNGGTEEAWQENRRKKELEEGLPPLSDAGCESPRYLGRAVVALATDPNVAAKSGQALSTGQLMLEYGFTDIDGRRPFWDWSKC